MRFSVLFILLSAFSFMLQAQDFKYPPTAAIEVKETFFENHTITDNYQWLEETKAPTVKKWINAQNDLTAPYLKKLQNRHNTYIEINRLMYTKFSFPQKQGKYYFEFRIYNNHATPALFYKTRVNSEYELLIDPNTIDSENKIYIQGYAVSANSEFLAFQYNRNGTDWTEIKVVTLGSGALKKDHLKNVKFSNIAWKGDGFFYSRYPQTDKFAKTEGQQIYFHKIGTTQEEDKLIFERNNPALQFSFQTTSDERFFLVKETNEKAGKINVFYLDYQDANPILKPLLINLKFGVSILDSHEGKFIATATQHDNNAGLVEIDPANPLKWRSISPKFSKAVLLRTIPLKDKIIAIYKSNQQPSINVLNYQGEILYNLELPVGSSVRGFDGWPEDEEFLFALSSYIFPPVVYSFNAKTYERKVTESTSINYENKDLVQEQIEATAADGTKIPMLLIYKKGMTLTGKNPTILSAYGGFGSVVSPSFDPGIVHFVKQGGIYAFANIRGGGDLGADWAAAGRGSKKQTSFNDFISCAEFLIDKGYTNAGKLATTGASNGGLVVAAAAMQRPELFKAVVPEVAPLDMLRFEKFTVGSFHLDEYGTTTNPNSFQNLLKYSPYHNIKPTVNYPAMLIMTSENDDRVPPFHSYKFAAALQNRPAQKNPVLLRVEKDAGHHGGATLSRSLIEKADMFGFIWEMLNQEKQ